MTIHSPHALANTVRRRRLDLGLSQSNLADRVGVSRKWIIDVERGKSTVALSHLLRLLDALELDLSVAPRESPSRDARDAPPRASTVDLDDLLRDYKR